MGKKILKITFFMAVGAVAGGLYGWLSRCAGGGA